jgi:hypothetical protein
MSSSSGFVTLLLSQVGLCTSNWGNSNARLPAQRCRSVDVRFWPKADCDHQYPAMTIRLSDTNRESYKGFRGAQHAGETSHDVRVTCPRTF